MSDTHTIDATGKKLGRVATEAATYLMDKHTTDFARHKEGSTKVVIENASKLSIDEKKLEQKIYDRYTGYPGGRRELKMEEVIEKKGYTEILSTAIRGMLPKNRLQAPRMKRLVIHE